MKNKLLCLMICVLSFTFFPCASVYANEVDMDPKPYRISNPILNEEKQEENAKTIHLDVDDFFKEQPKTRQAVTTSTIDISAGRESIPGYGYATGYYTIEYISQNNALNYVDVNIGSKYYLEGGKITMYSDYFYLNGSYLGEFKSNNGINSVSGNRWVYRSEKFRVRLYCGQNYILSFRAASGVSGNADRTINFDNINREWKRRKRM